MQTEKQWQPDIETTLVIHRDLAGKKALKQYYTDYGD